MTPAMENKQSPGVGESPSLPEAHTHLPLQTLCAFPAWARHFHSLYTCWAQCLECPFPGSLVINAMYFRSLYTQWAQCLECPSLGPVSGHQSPTHPLRSNPSCLSTCATASNADHNVCFCRPWPNSAVPESRGYLAYTFVATRPQPWYMLHKYLLKEGLTYGK